MYFAYGENRIRVEQGDREEYGDWMHFPEGCSGDFMCPAEEQDYHVGPLPVYLYDEMIQMVTGRGKGVVEEDVARKAWMKAIEYSKEENRTPSAINRMEKIADSYGWKA